MFPRNIRYSGLLASCTVIAFLLWRGALANDDTGISDSNPAPFPDITFLDELNVTHRLSTDKGKMTLVHFWATWCGPCVREFPEIDALQKTYGDKGLKILAISTEGYRHMDQVKAFYTQHAVANLKPYTDDGSTIRATHIRGMPTTFFLDSNGRNIAMAEGPVDWNSKEVRTFIEQHLK